MEVFKKYLYDRLLVESFVEANEFNMNDTDFEDTDEVLDPEPRSPKKQISNKGDFKVEGNKMLFNRVGPISGQVQTNKKAPARRGIWAFPWPLFDSFFVSGNFSFPQQMSPKNPNNKKLNTSEKMELQKVLDQKTIEINKIKGSVPNYKKIEETHPKLYNKILDLDFDIKRLKDLIHSHESIPLWLYYNAIGKEDEYEKIKKELPKAELTDLERKEYEKRKRDIERTMAALKPKIENPDAGDKYHKLNSDYENLEYQLSDINEILSGEGSKQLHYDLNKSKYKHTKIKQLWASAPLWARFKADGEIIGSGGSGNWHKFETIKEYLEALRKHIIQYSTSEKLFGIKPKEGEKPKVLKGVIDKIGQGDYKISIDALEVFIEM